MTRSLITIGSGQKCHINYQYFVIRKCAYAICLKWLEISATATNSLRFECSKHSRKQSSFKCDMLALQTSPQTCRSVHWILMQTATSTKNSNINNVNSIARYIKRIFIPRQNCCLYRRFVSKWWIADVVIALFNYIFIAFKRQKDSDFFFNHVKNLDARCSMFKNFDFSWCHGPERVHSKRLYCLDSRQRNDCFAHCKFSAVFQFSMFVLFVIVGQTTCWFREILEQPTDEIHHPRNIMYFRRTLVCSSWILLEVNSRICDHYDSWMFDQQWWIASWMQVNC